ncbi:hypothetical protein [Oerskovia paurometabola]|uniref:hypothetical protein n=1 Tax=Oerskovia paurometabola TaxID=162170 RepID=UPI003803A716
MPHQRSRAASLIAGTLGVGLLLGAGGTMVGTLAQWHAGSAAPGGTVTSGDLTVGVRALQDGIGGVPLEPGMTLESTFEVTARLEGDNLAAGLQVGLPAWADWEGAQGVDLRDVLDVTFTIDEHQVSGDLLDPAGPVLYLVQDASAQVGDGSVPAVVIPPEGITTTLVLRVSMAPWAGNEFQDRGLPPAELTAILDQVRPTAHEGDQP